MDNITLTVRDFSAETRRYSEEIKLDLNGVSVEEMCEYLSIEDILKNFDEGEILKYIGKQVCIDYFDL